MSGLWKTILGIIPVKDIVEFVILLLEKVVADTENKIDDKVLEVVKEIFKELGWLDK